MAGDESLCSIDLVLVLRITWLLLSAGFKITVSHLPTNCQLSDTMGLKEQQSSLVN